jgi:hypothetical protein
VAYPATFLDIQDAVIAKGRLDATNDRAKVKDWINQTQANVCINSEVLVTFADMATTAATVSYTLAATAVRIKGLYVTSGGVQYKPLEPISLERMLELRQSGGGSQTITGTLRYYCLVGLDQFELYPTPNGTETLTLYYVRQPNPLVNDTDVPELPEPYASKLLEYGALVEAADFKRDDQQQYYQQQYQQWLQFLRANLNRKRGGIPEQMMVYGSPTLPPTDPSTDVGY